jgi:hypothetical protein
VGGVLGIANFGSIHLAVVSSSAGLAERSLEGRTAQGLRVAIGCDDGGATWRAR